MREVGGGDMESSAWIWDSTSGIEITIHRYNARGEKSAKKNDNKKE